VLTVTSAGGRQAVTSTGGNQITAQMMRAGPAPVAPELTGAGAATITDTTAVLTCSSSNVVDGSVYVAVRTSGAFDENDAQLIIEAVSGSGGILYAANQAASASISFDATGLTPDTPHYYAFVQDGPMPLSAVLFDTFPTTAAPIGAPELTAATAVDKTDTTATLGCTSDDTTNGRVYCAVRISGAYGPGDELDIINGVGAIDSLSVLATAPLTFPVTGLTPDTVHYYGFVQDTDA
jgi:hypothetical protein